MHSCVVLSTKISSFSEKGYCSQMMCNIKNATKLPYILKTFKMFFPKDRIPSSFYKCNDFQLLPSNKKNSKYHTHCNLFTTRKSKQTSFKERCSRSVEIAPIPKITLHSLNKLHKKYTSEKILNIKTIIHYPHNKPGTPQTYVHNFCIITDFQYVTIS